MLNFFSKKPDPKEVLKQETRNLKRNEREIERERLGCVWCGVVCVVVTVFALTFALAMQSATARAEANCRHQEGRQRRPGESA